MEIDEMKLEEIEKQWELDSKFDETDLINETKKIPLLHSKYYKLYVRSALKVKKMKFDLIELQRVKTEYYNGSLAKEELDKRNWKPCQLKILRTDIPKYLESDKDIIELSLKISYHSENTKFLEEIIKQLNNRNFLIKNVIDYLKFTSGSI